MNTRDIKVGDKIRAQVYFDIKGVVVRGFKVRGTVLEKNGDQIMIAAPRFEIHSKDVWAVDPK